MTRKNPKRGFTLVEMLMVVTIIGVLVLLLVASIGGVSRGARATRVQAEIKGLEHAFRSYVQLYGRFPRVGAAATAGDPENISGTTNPLQRGLPVDAEMVDLLRGGNPRNMNPRRVVFMDIADASLNADGAFADAWGWPYRYMFDYNNDGNVFIYRYYRLGDMGSLTLRGRTIAVWSTGPTGWRMTIWYFDSDNIVGWDHQ